MPTKPLLRSLAGTLPTIKKMRISLGIILFIFLGGGTLTDTKIFLNKFEPLERNPETYRWTQMNLDITKLEAVNPNDLQNYLDIPSQFSDFKVNEIGKLYYYQKYDYGNYWGLTFVLESDNYAIIQLNYEKEKFDFQGCVILTSEYLGCSESVEQWTEVQKALLISYETESYEDFIEGKMISVIDSSLTHLRISPFGKIDTVYHKEFKK